MASPCKECSLGRLQLLCQQVREEGVPRQSLATDCSTRPLRPTPSLGKPWPNDATYDCLEDVPTDLDPIRLESWPHVYAYISQWRCCLLLWKLSWRRAQELRMSIESYLFQPPREMNFWWRLVKWHCVALISTSTSGTRVRMPGKA